MPEYLLGTLILLPYILAAVVTMLCWHFISLRLLFIVTAALSLSGLQGLVAPAAVSAFLPNLFLAVL